MSRPIFVATHPRACSTAFERVFMTQRDTLNCVHEPFGDAFYFGPERLGTRYETDETARIESGFSTSTYGSIYEKIMGENVEGKRVFIKDITHYLVPPQGKPASIAPSLNRVKRGVGTPSSSRSHSPSDSAVSIDSNEGQEKSASYPYPTETEPGNPTVIPTEVLRQFHFAFLIRHPKYSIPSYWRCTIPPLDDMTGFHNFMPAEAGYNEQRRVFDYLRSIGQIGPQVAGQVSKTDDSENKLADILVVDADDLLNDPEGIMRKFCESVGYPFNPEMLNWDNEEDQQYAVDKFEKWKGFHEDAIHSTSLKPRAQKKEDKSIDECFNQWVEKYGEDAAKVIRKTVEENEADYEYMKQFAIKA